MTIEFELKEYLEKEFKTLNEKMDQRFEGIEQRFKGIDQRFEGVDQRFEGIDQRFEGIEKEFKNINQKLGTIESELKDQRDTEKEITNDINVLKTKFNVLIAILSPIGLALLAGIVKIVFFSETLLN